MVYLYLSLFDSSNQRFHLQISGRRNLNRGICHTPIFDQGCHWHVPFKLHSYAVRLWFSVEISAEMYFKIPHFLVPSRALFSQFLFFFSFIFHLYFLLKFIFSVNLYLLLFIIYCFSKCPKKIVQNSPTQAVIHVFLYPWWPRLISW